MHSASSRVKSTAAIGVVTSSIPAVIHDVVRRELPRLQKKRREINITTKCFKAIQLVDGVCVVGASGIGGF